MTSEPVTTSRAPTVPPSPPPTAPELGTGGLALVLTGLFLAVVDFFIVNVALGDLGRRLHASTAQLELVVAGYGVSYAVLLVLGGRLGDTFGRRRVFATGMAGFVAASLLCGLAPSTAWLIPARILQGATAALLVPQVLATIQATTSGERRARAIGFVGATAGLGAVVGQVVGGWIVSADLAGSGWRPIFLVNVPIGLTALALCGRIPATRSARPSDVDVTGTLLIGAAVVSLLLPLAEGRAQGWPLWSWVLLALSPGFALALRRAELRQEAAGRVPLLPPSVVRAPTMSRGLALAVPTFAGFGGFMFCYAVATQQVIGWTPLRSGLVLAPMALTFLGASLLAPRFARRFGRSLLTFGFAVQAVVYPLLAVTIWTAWGPGPHEQLSAWDLAPLLAVAGFGQGLVFSPLFGLILSRVPVELAGVGSGVLATTQQSSLALGTAALGTAFTTLADRADAGPRAAFVTVALVQAAVAVAGIGLSRLLPDRGRTAPRLP